jgi:capsular polysaccharide export protein
MADIHLVFLQGMASPFFRRVGEVLRGRGCRVTRINLCIGDWIYWHGEGSVNYRGRYTNWSAFIGNFFDHHAVTDLVLLGEQRRYHKEAIAIAQARGIRVTVNDFGYLRPDWITLEKDGMGGNSRFPRNPVDIQKQSANLGSVDLTQRYTDSAFNMMFADLLYNFSNLFFGLLYPHYRRTDCRPHTLIYTLSSAKQHVLTRLRSDRSRRKVDKIVRSGQKYFVLPLQLDHDFQIVAYSSFSGMAEVIRLTIESFAQFATGDDRLIVKVHPWDTGLVNWSRVVRLVADEQGVSGRVDYLDGGSLDDLARHAEGMVTVNSTSGLHALQVNCPVKVLGQAVYDVPGLTFQGELNAFWQSNELPNAELLTAFVTLMAHTIQIRGVYFDEPGCTAAVQSAANLLDCSLSST